MREGEKEKRRKESFGEYFFSFSVADEGARRRRKKSKKKKARKKIKKGLTDDLQLPRDLGSPVPDGRERLLGDRLRRDRARRVARVDSGLKFLEEKEEEEKREREFEK